MKVLKATEEQYTALNGFSNGPHVLKFILDADGFWIVGKSVLTDPAFLEIRPQLEQLQEIPFNPAPAPPDEV